MAEAVQVYPIADETSVNRPHLLRGCLAIYAVTFFLAAVSAFEGANVWVVLGTAWVVC